MATKALKEILTRAETLPEAAQEEAVASLLAIEEELRSPYPLTEAGRPSTAACRPSATASLRLTPRWKRCSPNTGVDEGRFHQAGRCGA
jgi:hypothetical protein